MDKHGSIMQDLLDRIASIDVMIKLSVPPPGHEQFIKEIDELEKEASGLRKKANALKDRIILATMSGQKESLTGGENRDNDDPSVVQEWPTNNDGE